MNQSDSPFAVFDVNPNKPRWDLMDCDNPGVALVGRTHFVKVTNKRRSPQEYSPDWEKIVPNLIEKLVSEVANKKKLELRFNLLEIVTKDLKAKVNQLESAQTRIIPINTLAPAPYEILKPFLISVQPVEDEFEAGWFDANIHFSGDNEQDAVSNLKELILDTFETYITESPETLGPEPTRQLAVMKEYIQRKP